MRYLKTFEELTKVPGKCDRCGQPSNVFKGSIFNEEMICMDCIESEKERPDYTLAKQKEAEEVRKGNFNYKGLWNESKKFESSEFFTQEHIDQLLDKISDSGIESLSDIDKNQLKLFSEDDKEIIETIQKMGDITNQFRELNQKMRDIQSKGDDPYYLMKDWMELNDQLRPLESSFRKWGIELGDPRLDKMMRK
jgi:hypothetical protein